MNVLWCGPAMRQHTACLSGWIRGNALLAAVRGLVAGGEPGEVLGRLEVATHRGDAMPPGRARECYDAGVGALERAAGTCRVLEWDKRLVRVQEGVRWLCLARVELRKGSGSGS